MRISGMEFDSYFVDIALYLWMIYQKAKKKQQQQTNERMNERTISKDHVYFAPFISCSLSLT